MSRSLRPLAAALALGAAAAGIGPAARAQVTPSGDTTRALVQPTALQPPVRAALTGVVPPPAPTGRINTPVDPDMLAVLTQLAMLQPAPYEVVAPAYARQFAPPAVAANQVLRATGRANLVQEPTQSGSGAEVRDQTIPGPGGPLAVRVYRPLGAAPGAGSGLPVIVYFHGGGWVIADRNAYDGGARGLSVQANAVVISVDYRRAPEAKFPAAHDDALAAYRWALANAASIGGDPRRVALAGESAGGNLAVAPAIAARDARIQAPTHVLAVYPVAGTDTTTGSYQQYAFAKPLDRGVIGWFVGYTVRTPADLKDPRLDLVHANLRGLAPVTIVNAEIDPLRDDGAMLERALRAVGVPVERRLYSGVTHEFFGLATTVAKAAQAQQYAGTRLKAAFAR